MLPISGFVPILILIISALFASWLMAAWLPARTATRRLKFLLAALISLGELVVSGVGLLASGGSLEEMLSYYDRHNTGLIYTGLTYCLCAPLLSTPFVAGAAALLYLGGKAARSQDRLADGKVMIVFGFLLWIVSTIIYVFVVNFWHWADRI